MKNNGIFVFSLDLELMWGVLDSKGLGYLAKAELTSKSLHKLLETFEAYSINCTWGVVGALRYTDILALDQVKLKAALDQRGVSYENVVEIATHRPAAFFCKDFITSLLLSDQDVISHTFHHIEMSKSGLGYLRNELSSWEACFGRPPRGLIFCRNSYDENCLDILEDCNVKFFRGEPDIWFMALGGFLKKVCRFVDSFLPLWSGAIDRNKCGFLSHTKLSVVPHTLFFRTFPTSWLLLKRLHILRVKLSMLYAARFNKVVHLWCHPHNFSVGIYDLSGLKEVLEFYVTLNRKYGFSNYTMKELADEKYFGDR